MAVTVFIVISVDRGWSSSCEDEEEVERLELNELEEDFFPRTVGEERSATGIKPNASKFRDGL